MQALAFSELLSRLGPVVWISREVPGGPWMISADVNGESVYLETARGEVRQFRSLDTVLSVLHGFAYSWRSQFTVQIFVNGDC